MTRCRPRSFACRPDRLGADGVIQVIVDSTAKYPKIDFPTEAVLRPGVGAAAAPGHVGGKFDDVRRSYLSNVIVFATPAP
jgi:hypothetical protein